MNATEYSGRCMAFQEEPWRCEVILVVQRVCSSISFLGCCFVIFTIWLFRRYKATPQRFILFIAISGAGHAFANLLAASENMAFCRIIGFLNTLADWALLLWVFGIAIQLFRATYRHGASRRYEWLYHYVIWPVSLIFALAPFFPNKYGNSGVWCWMVADTGWRMGVWYVPLFVIAIITLVLYILIIVKFRKLINKWDRTYTPEVEANKKFLKDEVWPLVSYPFVYIILYAVPLVNRIQNAVMPSQPIFGLMLTSSITVAILGAVNSLVYGLDQETRRKLRADKIKTAWYSHFTPEVNIGVYDMEVVDPNLSVIDHNLPVIDPKLSVTDPKLSVTDPNLPVVGTKLPVTDPKLSVTDTNTSVRDPHLLNQSESSSPTGYVNTAFTIEGADSPQQRYPGTLPTMEHSTEV